MVAFSKQRSDRDLGNTVIGVAMHGTAAATDNDTFTCEMLGYVGSTIRWCLGKEAVDSMEQEVHDILNRCLADGARYRLKINRPTDQ